jgi:NADH dehydrogenase|tara:strand:+ start:9730 stop:10659 length:930 start_codon:yes stop_codon:yes gene_type:complete
MKVALFGSTGFVGTYLVDELIASGYSPRVLVRPGSESKLSQAEKCEIIIGDLSERKAVAETISGAEAVIYLVGIIREFPRKGITFEDLHFKGCRDCMNLALEMGVKRFILMSTNGGVKMDGTGYQKTKFLAEQYLKNTVLDWTIFRPSFIFGDPRGGGRPEFCSHLKRYILSLPIPAPLFFDGIVPKNVGTFSMSPVHVIDVAKCFVGALTKESSIEKTYHLGGEAYYWKDIIKIIAEAYGKNKWTMPAPVFAIKGIAALIGRFAWFPITKDQITMLVEGNVCDSEKIFKMFDIEPIPFNSESLFYLQD